MNNGRTAAGRALAIPARSSSIFVPQRHSTIFQSMNQRYASTLPKLPVPPLQQTIDKFLRLAQPLVTPDQFAHTKQLTKEFVVNGDGLQLQSLLEDRAKQMPNWLSSWWLNVAYLDARTPLPVVTSPGIMFPKFPYRGIEAQIDYASKLILAALRYYQNICNNAIEPDMLQKDTPLDMGQYQLLFGTTRIPNRNRDRLRYGKDLSPPARHIVVTRNGHLFYIPVIDTSGEILSVAQIRDQLNRIVLPASEIENDQPVGVVTSENRDTWADMYQRLKVKNADRLELIETALFVVCIDKRSVPLAGYTDRDEQALQALQGGGTRKNSANRWFDKTIQFVIGFDGYISTAYEHSPAEGPPVANLMDYICDQFVANNFGTQNDSHGSIETGHRLDFVLDDDDKRCIASASANVNEMSFNIDLRSYTFDEFGKNFPKSQKISPDSFIQLAYQLAYYRLHLTHPPTYETATCRKFQHGRTDTIRLPNTESVDFVLAMSEQRGDYSYRADLLRKAAEAHKQYSIEAMNGNAIDRHLLGLRLIAAEHNRQTPALFSDVAYNKMMHFKLSTSQVPTRHFIQMCFGPSAPDCYGVCYNPQNDALHFTVSTFNSCRETDAKKFCKALETSLMEMENVLLSAKVWSKI